MFKLRVLSALVMLPLVIVAILFLPTIYIAVASAFVFSLAAWEWLSMTEIKQRITKIILLSLLISVGLYLYVVSTHREYVYVLSVIWWLCGFVGICYFPRGKQIWQQGTLQPFIGLVMFVPAWLAFNQLHSQPQGPLWVLLGCSLIWGADIGAYCCGKLWGNTKLIEKISPGKTWAGFYGALGAGCLIMLGFYYFLRPEFNWVHAIWLALVTVLFSIIGDLVESLIKRVYGAKDSGTLIPGHGGVYDRIDSMLAAFPIYVLGLQILQNLRIMAL